MNTGNTLELTQIGNVDYSASTYSSTSAVPAGGFLRLDDVIVHVADDVFTSNDAYTHMILQVMPINVYGEDGVLHNNYYAKEINVADTTVSK